jgi:hypothetical protein
VTEDDSQDGVDHVEGHRTVGLVISPYTRRGIVDSTFYTIVNMYRTIEQILGLPPRNQFDRAAEPMFTTFTSKPDLRPYNALPNNIPLDEMNPQLAGLQGLQRELAEFSLALDSSELDSADADTLNRAIWHSVKGFDAPYNHGRPLRRHPLRCSRWRSSPVSDSPLERRTIESSGFDCATVLDSRPGCFNQLTGTLYPSEDTRS